MPYPCHPCSNLQGVRTLVLTNATGAALARERAEGQRFNEHWVHVPDVEGFAVTNKSGDHRAALAPLLARDYFGASSFKWGSISCCPHSSVPGGSLPSWHVHVHRGVSADERRRSGAHGWRAPLKNTRFCGRPPLLLPQVAAVY